MAYINHQGGIGRWTSSAGSAWTWGSGPYIQQYSRTCVVGGGSWLLPSWLPGSTTSLDRFVYRCRDPLAEAMDALLALSDLCSSLHETSSLSSLQDQYVDRYWNELTQADVCGLCLIAREQFAIQLLCLY